MCDQRRGTRARCSPQPVPAPVPRPPAAFRAGCLAGDQVHPALQTDAAAATQTRALMLRSLCSASALMPPPLIYPHPACLQHCHWRRHCAVVEVNPACTRTARARQPPAQRPAARGPSAWLRATAVGRRIHAPSPAPHACRYVDAEDCETFHHSVASGIIAGGGARRRCRRCVPTHACLRELRLPPAAASVGSCWRCSLLPPERRLSRCSAGCAGLWAIPAAIFALAGVEAPICMGWTSSIGVGSRRR